MAKSKKSKPQRDRIREEILRPCPSLGYDHDAIASHLMSREAFKIAEDEFRRAIWLNPYEPIFKEHLALCLFRQKRYEEALKQISEVLKENPECKGAIALSQLIKTNIEKNLQDNDCLNEKIDVDRDSEKIK